MDDASTPRLPGGVRLQEDKVRGAWTLLGPERVFQLDDIAVEILKRCDGEASLRAIEQDLADAFEAEPSEIRSDVRDFLTGMIEKGMVVL